MPAIATIVLRQQARIGKPAQAQRTLIDRATSNPDHRSLLGATTSTTPPQQALAGWSTSTIEARSSKPANDRLLTCIKHWASRTSSPEGGDEEHDEFAMPDMTIDSARLY